MRAAIALLVVAFGSGCSAELVSPFGGGPLNSCSRDSDCGDGACVAKGDGSNVCVARTASLDGLLLEVHPSITSSYSPDRSFLLSPPADVLSFNAAPNRFDVSLPELATIAGTISTKQFANCATPGATLSADVELTPVYPARAISGRATTAKSQALIGPKEFGFTATVVPGVYDIYVEVHSPDGCKPFPPTFLRAQNLSGGLVISLDDPYDLVGKLAIPQLTSPNGWSIEVLDPNQGRVISTTQTISGVMGAIFSVDLDLSFHLQKGETPLVRLRPPDGLIAPSVLWDLQGGSLDPMTRKVTIDLDASGLVTEKREVGGTVTGDTGKLGATINIQSEKLSGSVAENAAYVTTIVSPDGNIDTFLPKGTYRVVALPNDPAFALSSGADWTIDTGDGCSCGHGILLEPPNELRGEVSGPDGSALAGIDVEANPSYLEPPPSFLASVVTVSSVAPRQTSATSDASGVAAMSVDPGSFDVSVRPLDGSSYPWTVAQHVVVKAGEPLDLGGLAVVPPAVLTGSITDPNLVALPDTAVAAWLPIPGTDVAVQIGETVTDAHGQYWLPLPPGFAP